MVTQLGQSGDLGEMDPGVSLPLRLRRTQGHRDQGVAESPHSGRMSYLGQPLALSVVVMGIARTLTPQRMFEPLRERLGGHETRLGVPRPLPRLHPAPGGVPARFP